MKTLRNLPNDTDEQRESKRRQRGWFFGERPGLQPDWWPEIEEQPRFLSAIDVAEIQSGFDCLGGGYDGGEFVGAPTMNGNRCEPPNVSMLRQYGRGYHEPKPARTGLVPVSPQDREVYDYWLQTAREFLT